MCGGCERGAVTTFFQRALRMAIWMQPGMASRSRILLTLTRLARLGCQSSTCLLYTSDAADDM
eukprot:6628445-Prymnesium_polylepis.1